MVNCVKYRDIAEFQKVSFDQYVKDRGVLDAYDEEGNKALLDAYRREWEEIKLPCRATGGSAGYDFFLPVNACVTDHPLVVQTGIRVRMNPGWVLLLFPRSGLAYKYGLRLVNSVGVIDEDYYFAANEGHISAKLYTGEKNISLDAGDRFMQGIFLPYGTVMDDHSTGIRTGGTGSTGLG